MRILPNVNRKWDTSARNIRKWILPMTCYTMNPCITQDECFHKNRPSLGLKCVQCPKSNSRLYLAWVEERASLAVWNYRQASPMAQLDKRMELRLDRLLQLLRRERGEFWASSQQLWDAINMLICMIDSIPELLRWVSTIMGCYQPCVQTGQHWAKMVWCSGRRTTSRTWVLRQQQARYYVQKARKVFYQEISLI